jgi:arylsulfatase A-like enzyme
MVYVYNQRVDSACWDALKQPDLTKSTLVVYTIDHGDVRGEAGSFDNHLIILDEVVRVRSMLRRPAHLVSPPTLMTCRPLAMG